MKKILSLTGILIGICIIVIIIRTFLFTSKQLPPGKPVDYAVNVNQVARHLSEAIKIKAISQLDNNKNDKKVFRALHSYLEKTYPRSHRVMQKEVIQDLSLLYTWKGTDETLQPILLLAHLDVVNVEKGTHKDWKYPPFHGTIADGYIWGRGALDMKEILISIMEATEYLISQGFKPKRTIYLAFGHDEERGGPMGNKKIASLLKSRGIRFSLVLDEGGFIASDVLKGISSPTALVGIAEKGYLSLELETTGKGGHSAMPPAHTAVGKLATAIHRLEQEEFPLEISGGMKKMFEYAGPEMPFGKKVALANLWLFEPLVSRQLAAKRSGNAMMRTTMAATMIQGSEFDNVLPRKARAVINFRIYPGSSTKDIFSHVKEVIDNEEITVNFFNAYSEPSAVTDVNSKEFKVLQKLMSHQFPESIVVPYVVPGTTDSKHYSGISDNILRFLPVRVDPEELKGMHGTNERISIKNLKECVNFYIRFIKEFQE